MDAAYNDTAHVLPTIYVNEKTKYSASQKFSIGLKTFSLVTHFIENQYFVTLYFRLCRSCKQIKNKLLENDSSISGDKNSSKSLVDDAKRL